MSARSDVSVSAFLDQEKATLATIVGVVREHRTRCDMDSCPGREVVELLQGVDPQVVRMWLNLALYKLAGLVDADHGRDETVWGQLAGDSGLVGDGDR